MTIHFHGSPITGGKGPKAAIASYRDGGAFISFAAARQIDLAFEFSKTVCIDNGAFSMFNSGKVPDWNKFYFEFLPRWISNEKLRFFVIPDDIEGGEKENDALLDSVPIDMQSKGAPVWHMHESIERLLRLCRDYEYVCIGSSGEYYAIRSQKWKERMKVACMAIIESGSKAKIHGLRMLDGRVLGNYPLDQADSTNIAINVGKYDMKMPEVTVEACRALTHPTKWVEPRHSYDALSKFIANGGDKADIAAYRAAVLRGAIESVKPPGREEWYKSQ